jgi:phage I-like protein
VAVALAEGRIAPHEQATLRRFEETDPDGLRSYLAKRAKNSAIPTGPSQAALSAGDTTPTGPDPGLSAKEKEAANFFGVKDPAAVKNFRPQQG